MSGSRRYKSLEQFLKEYKEKKQKESEHKTSKHPDVTDYVEDYFADPEHTKRKAELFARADDLLKTTKNPPATPEADTNPALHHGLSLETESFSSSSRTSPPLSPVSSESGDEHEEKAPKQKLSIIVTSPESTPPVTPVPSALPASPLSSTTETTEESKVTLTPDTAKKGLSNPSKFREKLNSSYANAIQSFVFVGGQSTTADTEILKMAEQKHQINDLKAIQSRALGVFDSYLEQFVDSGNENSPKNVMNRYKRETINGYAKIISSIPCDFSTHEEFLQIKAEMIKIMKSFFLHFKPLELAKSKSLQLVEDLLNDSPKVYYQMTSAQQEAQNAAIKLEQKKAEEEKRKAAVQTLFEQHFKADEELNKLKVAIMEKLAKCETNYPNHPSVKAGEHMEYFKTISTFDYSSPSVDKVQAEKDFRKQVAKASQFLVTLEQWKQLEQSKQPATGLGRFANLYNAVSSAIGSGSKSKNASPQPKGQTKSKKR